MSNSTSQKLLDWQSRWSIWILYLVAGSMTLILFHSATELNAVTIGTSVTWPDMRMLWKENDVPGWSWCLATCVLSTLTVFITGKLPWILFRWNNYLTLFPRLVKSLIIWNLGRISLDPNLMIMDSVGQNIVSKYEKIVTSLGCISLQKKTRTWANLLELKSRMDLN